MGNGVQTIGDNSSPIAPNRCHPHPDVGKVYEKCCFGVGKVYIDGNDRGREVSFALGLIAMSILGISFGRHKGRVAM